MLRLAIVATHPIQYQAPWFRHLNAQPDLGIKVFYLFDPAVAGYRDSGFGQAVRWDVPLLAGYEYEFVPNKSKDPGTHHFGGLRNPSLIKCVEAFHPDTVLLMGYNFHAFMQFILFWNREKAPLVFRGDSNLLSRKIGLEEKIKGLWRSLIFRRFSAFLYCGKANRDYFLSHGVSERGLFFSPHAVDNDRFFLHGEDVRHAAEIWKNEIGVPQEHHVILFAGKFDEVKSPLDLLRAFSMAALHRTVLLFVGAGRLAEKLKEEARSVPGVFFAPFQNQTQMAKVYKAGDLLVLPSRSETWGLSVNEAMCMGLPVIVSDHVGCWQDLVAPYENGLIFEAGDVPDLARCLREALSDETRLQAWGRASREKISQYSYIQATQGLKQALEFIGK